MYNQLDSTNKFKTETQIQLTSKLNKITFEFESRFGICLLNRVEDIL